MKGRVVIVGGGIMALTTAYNIALLGERDVTIVEQGYIASGASCRNAGHFRVHFWAPENARFAIEANKRLLDFASKLKWDPQVHRGGYFWLLYKEEQIDAYKRTNNELWAKLGISGKTLTPEEISEEYPYVNIDGVIAGFFGPHDGKLNPDIINFGYREKAEELGVRFQTYTKAEGIVVKGGRVKGVRTNKGFIEAERVLVAAGAWSNELLKAIDIDLPIEPERKEIGVTEPIKYFMKPLVISMKTGAFIGQHLRGEILGSMDYPVVKGLAPLVNTLDWVHAWAKEMSGLVPLTKRLMVLRAWSGYYTMTPDNSHILGRDLEWPENLYLATGFSGHGFMMAPLVGELMAKNILYDEIDDLMRPFLPARFKERKLINETMVIG